VALQGTARKWREELIISEFVSDHRRSEGLTGAQLDYTAAEPLMKLPLPKPKALLADKGYDGDRFRESLLTPSNPLQHGMATPFRAGPLSGDYQLKTGS